MSSASSSRIFVQIVSYRDPECHHTIRDLFEKASYPERIFVGVCWQYDPQEDSEYLAVDYPRPEQVRVIQYHANEAQGAGWARVQAQSLWQGEEYTLQIQAHHRFEPGWDDTLIEMLSRCPSEKPAISAYLPPYTPPNALKHYDNALLRIRVREFGKKNDPQILHITGTPVPLSGARAGLYVSPFWIGNFLFAKSSLFYEVPTDPHIYFFAEEIMYSARLYTHGFDIFQPDRVVAYHQWNRRETGAKQSYRRGADERNQRSLARVLHLLGLKPANDAQALLEQAKFGLGTKRTLEEFCAFAGIDLVKRTATEKALKGVWNEAKNTKRQIKSMPRIFIQIASYRDPDCQWTLKDLFEKAAHPERIFVGICWQVVEGEDDICFKEPYPRPEQVRVKKVDARESKGACWARSETQKLWQGEEFTLQIDSHMRFEPGWDDLLLEMWNACENPNAVLTCYPPGFTPPDKLERGWVFAMAAKEFDKNGILLMHGKPAFKEGAFPPKPMPGAFLSGCLFFGPSRMIADVPYDPHLYFFGEEISMAARLWTHGYDFYHPNQLVIYHDWDRGKRPLHFTDHRDIKTRNELSFARVRHLLGTETSGNAEVTRDLAKYGLGSARTLDAYQAYSGVNFATKTISDHALKGQFGMKKQAAADAKTARIFVSIASYRDSECQWTVKDLFEKAANPERIFVGICWQFDEQEDRHCFEMATRPEQVRVIPVDWREGEGVCWARHQVQQLWDGEEYVLQIDAHMRFVPGWDELMIDELAACESQKPVLSCSPASYTPPNNLQKDPRPAIRRARPFQPDGNIRGKGEALDRVPEKPLNGAFVAAGFMFSRADIIREVPYDPYMYFDQEEITYAARLYTHGWDIFSSRRPLLYHYYNDQQAEKGSVRPLHWRDLRKEDEKKIAYLRNRGLARFNHLTGFAAADHADALRELDTYGFGRVRSLAQYEAYSGIDFKYKIAGEKALRCLFIEGLEKYRDKPVHVPELDEKKAAPAAKRAPQKPLEAGDFVPLFRLQDSSGKGRAIETSGGKHCMLYFLPAGDEAYVTRFFRALYALRKEQGKINAWSFFVMAAPLERVNALRERVKIAEHIWLDEGGALARAFGVSGPAGFLLNANLKILARHDGLAPDALAKTMMTDCADAIKHTLEKQGERRVIAEVPPVLIVPNAFSPEFCARCIEAFRKGRTFEGTVGAEEKLKYAPNAKVRTDFVPSGALLAEIDDKLSRSVFPEIKKVFGFEVRHREYYKIGLYTGEKGGFFKQHRDNFDTPLGYRRVAMTVHLNDEYEGGGLHFPEYDNHIYRPAQGSAIAFSGATLHEALPVTAGERFVLVAFMHGEQDEAYRRHYLAAKGSPLKIKDFTPTLREYPGLQLSRDFYDDWQKKHVHYGEQPVSNEPAMTAKPNPLIASKNTGPKKVFESKQAIIYDDFLPNEVYERLRAFALKTDYEYVNTKGKVPRAWHVQDGFPLRSTLNAFYYAPGVQKPQGNYVYPTQTDLDLFIDRLLAIQPEVERITGRQGEGWVHVSATCWLYPHGSGLSLHDDGSGVYTGAYVYFLNPEWKPHWGGLLLLVDEEGNQRVHDHRKAGDQKDFYQRKFLHANALDELVMENGFAKCIFPKKNRIVFIANDAYHMVTRVNEQCGDNIRMSIAGFYNRKK